LKLLVVEFCDSVRREQQEELEKDLQAWHEMQQELMEQKEKDLQATTI
jgi:hypothetical protein